MERKCGSEVARNSMGWQADEMTSHRSIESRRALDHPDADHHSEQEANPLPLCKALRVGWRSYSLMELSHHYKINKYRTTLLYTRCHTHTIWVGGRRRICMCHAYNAGLRFGALRQVTSGAWHVGPTGGRPTCHTPKGRWRHSTSTWFIDRWIWVLDACRVCSVVCIAIL